MNALKNSFEILYIVWKLLKMLNFGILHQFLSY